MKNIILFFVFFVCTSLLPTREAPPVDKSSATQNIFIIITDGFRWQEVFTGADSTLINNSRVTPDTGLIKAMFWDNCKESRRKKLLPFFWNVIAKKGQLYGNRELGNKVDVANPYAVSYPGYNEIFTGSSDWSIFNNRKRRNPNINVFEFLNRREAFRDSVVVFSSWDAFPFILHQERNGLPVNSGYQKIAAENQGETIINAISESGVKNEPTCRYDQLTFTLAKNYIEKHSPRVVVIGLGETDEFAHKERYDLYLQQANQFDRMLAELWNFVQSSPIYRDKTSFLITTDHGRGSKRWSKHGLLINGSSQTWLAMLGPKIPGRGEVNQNQQLYNRQFAELIANLVGENFRNN